MEEDKLKYKEILCNTMKSFINICKEHNLQYYACAGTCLGAIRHKGMIPWDDDIDVLMPRSDYDKFLALKQKLQGTGYEIVDSNNQFYNQWFAKFSDANTTIVEITDFPIVFGVYVDIFPLDEVGNLDVAKKLHEEKSKYFDKYRRTFKKTFFRNCINLFIHMHIKTFLKEIYYASIGKVFKEHYFFKYKHAEDLIQKQRGQKCMCYGGFYGFEKELCEKEWFGKGVEVPFEDFSIIVPNNYHAYLTRFYNDYMTPPPPQYRESHHSRYFVDLDRRWDIEDVLKMKPQKSHKIVRRYES